MLFNVIIPQWRTKVDGDFSRRPMCDCRVFGFTSHVEIPLPGGGRGLSFIRTAVSVRRNALENPMTHRPAHVGISITIKRSKRHGRRSVHIRDETRHCVQKRTGNRVCVCRGRVRGILRKLPIVCILTVTRSEDFGVYRSYTPVPVSDFGGGRRRYRFVIDFHRLRATSFCGH